MGWCYCVEIDISLPSDALAAIEKRPAGEGALPRRWSGLRDAALEASLGRPLSSGESFAEALGWFDGARLPAAQRREMSGAMTRVHVITGLDSSLLDHAFPLVALFHVARDVGGTGALRLVDDGTDGARGAELRIDDREIVRARIEDDWALVSRIDAALASRGTAETSAGAAKTSGVPKAARGVPKASRRVPKASRGVPKASRGVPKASRGVPKASPGHTKPSVSKKKPTR